MKYVYLHGFASGARSRKAQAFQAALAARGIELEIPELDEGNFAHLTISGQLGVIERTLAGHPARIAGSSMGGYLAALYASTHPEVDRLVLLAPAFSFAERWDDLVSLEGIARWRETGWLEVFHYGHGEQRPIHYGLYEDALQHPPNPAFAQSARIFHGVDDSVVPIHLSRRFSREHPNARLTEFKSGHELLNVLPEITAAGVDFLTARDLTGRDTGLQTR